MGEKSPIIFWKKCPNSKRYLKLEVFQMKINSPPQPTPKILSIYTLISKTILIPQNKITLTIFKTATTF